MVVSALINNNAHKIKSGAMKHAHANASKENNAVHQFNIGVSKNVSVSVLKMLHAHSIGNGVNKNVNAFVVMLA